MRNNTELVAGVWRPVLGNAADADRSAHRARGERPCRGFLRPLRHRHRHYPIRAQVAADMLGLPLDNLAIRLGDSTLP